MKLDAIRPNFTGTINAVARDMNYGDGKYSSKEINTEQIRNIRKLNNHHTIITVRETDEEARQRGAFHPDYRDYMISCSNYNTVLNAYTAASLNKNVSIRIPEMS